MLVVFGHLGGLVFIMSRKIAGSALCGGGFFVENAPEMQKFEVTALKCAAMRCGIGSGEWRFGCPADNREARVWARWFLSHGANHSVWITTGRSN